MNDNNTSKPFFEKDAPSLEALKKLKNFNLTINAYEIADTTCPMKVLPCAQIEIPTSATEGEMNSAIDFFNVFELHEQDWKEGTTQCQQMTNDFYRNACILVLAGEARVFAACERNYVERKGSKPNDYYQGGSEIERTLLSLKFAKEDAKSEPLLITRSKNVIYDQAGEFIFVIAKWDAYVAYKLVSIAMKNQIKSATIAGVITTVNDVDDTIVINGVDENDAGVTNYNKAGKAEKSITKRKNDFLTYIRECPVDGTKVYLEECFLPLPLISVSNKVTASIEGGSSFVFSGNGDCFNQKPETVESTANEHASVEKSFMFYLSATDKRTRKVLYQIYISAKLYWGYKLRHNRPAYQTLIDQFRSKFNDTQVESIRVENNINVLDVLRSVSSNDERSLYNVLCPAREEVSSRALRIAVAVALATSGEQTVLKYLDAEHRQILDTRMSRLRSTPTASSSESASSSEGRQGSNASTASGSSPQVDREVASRALVVYDPMEEQTAAIKELLKDSGILSTSFTLDKDRVEQAILLFSTIEREDLVVALIRDLNVQAVVNLLNGQLDNISDDDFHVDVIDKIRQMQRFQASEFERGKGLHYLNTQVILALNRIHSHDNCTLYNNTILYAKLTMVERITKDDPNAHFLVPREHVLWNWYNVLIGTMSNSGRATGVSYYRTLPIEDTRNSKVFDPFALALFNSINCNPGDMRVRHDVIVNSGFNKRMKLMNARDRNSRRGPRPTG